MTSSSICPLVIAKLLRVTRASWEIAPQLIPQDLVHLAAVASPSDGQMRPLRNGEFTLRLAHQRFDLLGHTGWSAHPRLGARHSDWEALPSA
jgi:hypothetical protein